MSAEQQHTSVKNPKRIYFMLPVYLVGGGRNIRLPHDGISDCIYRRKDRDY